VKSGTAESGRWYSAALCRRPWPGVKDRYEVIVVDNGSTGSLEPIVAKFPQAWMAYEDKLGSYAARNKGISLAKGGVLAFTDADCIPQRDWIENGVRRLVRTRGCGLVAGKIQVNFRETGRPTTVRR
jgi:glycosyltransferase involved in cell wall biosynthesis